MTSIRWTSAAALAVLMVCTSPALAQQVTVSIDAAPTSARVGEATQVRWSVQSPDPVFTAVLYGDSPDTMTNLGRVFRQPAGSYSDTLIPTQGGTLYWSVYVQTGQTRGRTQARAIMIGQAQVAPGAIETILGNGSSDPLPGGTFSAGGTMGGRSWGVAVSNAGDTYCGLFDAGAIARLNADGTASVVVNGLDKPMVFDFLANDDLVIADRGNDRVLLATAASGYAQVREVLGSGTVSAPGAVRLGGNGKVYVADTGNHRVLELEPDFSAGRVVAGGAQGLAGDGGAATAASLNFPIDVDVDARGALVIADAVNNRLRVVNLNAQGSLTVAGVRVAAGQIETLCGSGPAGAATTGSLGDSGAPGGYSGDGGPALRAEIDWPFAPRFDASGGVWFVDADNHRVRRILNDGTISTVAGSSPLPQTNGSRGVGSEGRDLGDTGPAIAADLNHSMDLELLEDAGTVTLLIGDTDNCRVRRVAGLSAAPVPVTDTQAPTFAGVARVTPRGSAGLDVRWAPASDDRTPADAIRFEVFVSTQAGGHDFSQPTLRTAAGALAAQVNGLAPDTRYFVVVRAVDQAGNADANTRALEARTEPLADTQAPTFAGVQGVQAQGQSGLALSWAAATDAGSAANRIRYRVYLATAAGGQDFTTPTVETSRGALSATLTGLQAGTRYFVVVRAVDAVGNEDLNTRERSATTDAAQPQVSFRDVQAVYAANCSFCHTQGGPAPFSLDPAVAFANTVNAPSRQLSSMPLVTPGDPSRSYLLHKVEGTHTQVGGGGRRMPIGNPLSAQDVATLRAWIAAGAPNN